MNQVVDSQIGEGFFPDNLNVKVVVKKQVHIFHKTLELNNTIA